MDDSGGKWEMSVYGIYCNHTLSVIEFVEGHPTLQPRFLRSDNLLSPPVPMDSRKQLAIGRHAGVTVFSLDAEGRMTGAYKVVRLKGREFRALHYSPRFDRLYMAGKLAP